MKFFVAVTALVLISLTQIVVAAAPGMADIHQIGAVEYIISLPEPALLSLFGLALVSLGTLGRGKS